MPPPRKRPRLEAIGASTPEPDVELEIARQQNDDLLKTRWEDIFLRYEKDFTGVGDEIGVESGRIEVDNGHIRNMQNETDTGENSEDRPRFDGRRMLRAMTVAPSDYSGSITEDDDVLQSIEAIADNAILSDDFSNDDLFERAGGAYQLSYDRFSKPEFPGSASLVSTAPHSLAVSTILPNWIKLEQERSSSPDSLFDIREKPTVSPKYQRYVRTSKSSTATSLDAPTSDTVLERADIRAEVRRIMEEERHQKLVQNEDQIDAAWRIPVHVSPMPDITRKFASGQKTSARFENRRWSDSVKQMNSQTDDRRRNVITPAGSAPLMSLWAGPKRRRGIKSVTTAEKKQRVIRADSEDPLHEGFSSELEQRKIVNRHAVRIHAIQPFQESSHSGNRKSRIHESRARVKPPDCSKNLPSTQSDRSSQPRQSQSEDSPEEPGGNSSGNLVLEATKRCEKLLNNYDTDRKNQSPVHSVAGRRKSSRINDQEPDVTVVSEQDAQGDEKEDHRLIPGTGHGQSTNMDYPTDVEMGRMVIRAFNHGECYYCDMEYTTNFAVGAHWDRVISRQVAQKLLDDDPHDITFITSIRNQAVRRVPKMRLSAFERMVELHEVLGHTFQHIHRTLRLSNWKKPHQVEEEYHVFRRPLEPDEVQHDWLEDEIATLQEILSQNADVEDSAVSMAGIHRIMIKITPCMSLTDIGNKVAELVLNKAHAEVRVVSVADSA